MGNEVQLPHNDFEAFEKPIFRYVMKKNKETDKVERLPVDIERTEVEYTLPFTSENLEALYKIGHRPEDDNHGISFGLVRRDSQGHTIGNSYNILNYEYFKSKPFLELYEWASIPKYALDRNIPRDQLATTQSHMR